MSSKLRKLKQQAYEAGKKRDWTAAVDAYAQILESDKSNPSLLNEYGDVCLKAGDAAKAVRQFLAAASKYKATGLLNNAQAIYKKVLRHDPDNLNANWFLAEVRASQGLMVEGEQHALKFLAAAEEVSGEIKEIFLKRCHELFDLYPESESVLEQLMGIFRLWDLPLDAARTGLLRACQIYRQGDQDTAATAVQDLIAKHPELGNYKEFSRWQALSGATPAIEVSSDVNSIQLDDGPSVAAADPAPEPVDEPVDEPADEPAVNETSFAGLDEDSAVAESSIADVAEENPAAVEPVEEMSFGDVSVDLGMSEQDRSEVSSSSEPAVDDVTTDDRDDEGCISIDVDTTSSAGGFGSLMDELADEAAEAVMAAEEKAAQKSDADEGFDLGGSVNLLDEILAEEGEDILRSSDTEQLSTIASEIGRNVGEDQDADPESQYQQGLVFLELGMFDQAALALETASQAPEYALQAREMWGIALQRAGQADDALVVFEGGLVGAEEENRLALGLRYHAGCILQELGRNDEAQEHFRLVHSVDAGFADVARRLRMQEV